MGLFSSFNISRPVHTCIGLLQECTQTDGRLYNWIDTVWSGFQMSDIQESQTWANYNIF